jgi:hypothetical protein
MAHSPTIPFGGSNIGGLQLIFLLSFIGRLGSLWLLHKVREPDESSIRTLIPGMANRSVRAERSVPLATTPNARAEAPSFDTAA